MILSVSKEQFDKENIVFGEKNNNNIIENSNFYGITYTNSLFTVHHVYIHFQLKNIYIEKYFNKYKIVFKDTDSNKETLEKLCDIENVILESFNKNAILVTKLKQQILNNNVKFVSNENIDKRAITTREFLVKISGIWENFNEIGLIYKIIMN